MGQAEDRERELLEKEKKTHNTARYFTEQRQVAWVVLLAVPVLHGIAFYVESGKDSVKLGEL